MADHVASSESQLRFAEKANSVLFNYVLECEETRRTGMVLMDRFLCLV
jgi:hypothetical protein